MNKPFFSVVIPTLNEEKYLPTLLTSLSQQSFRDFEVILVDGLSKDKTKEVFEKYQSRFPASFYITSEKANVSLQRNLGGNASTGKYILFFDADVDIGQTYLEEVHVAAVKQSFNLATSWMKADSENSLDQFMIFIANLGWELMKNFKKPILGGYNIIVKRKVFHALKGFRDDLIIQEDHDFAWRARKRKYRLTVLQEPKVVFSFRRFRSEGTLRVLRKYALSELYMLLKGPIPAQFVDYQMGGHVHIKKKRGIDKVKLKKYLSRIDQLQQNIAKLFSE